jgi:arylsulfatase A-like enzyme/Tfp pilus assembly protein PilF
MKTKLAILIVVAIVAVAGFSLYKWWKTKQPGAGAFPDYNVVLITIDTLRADHLPVYGYTKAKTPSIDNLASESLIFEDAVAHTPMTLPSHASILTGMLPVGHGIRDNAGYRLKPDHTSIAEILKNKGYYTGAFVSAFVLDSQFGLDQGFDTYSDSFTLARPRVNNTDTQRRAEDTQAEVHLWLEQARKKKFFLWVHYYDPHDPYDPPAPFKNDSFPYDGEIAYTDEVLGRLLKAIDPVKEKTIVVLTGDHGESLGEHQEQTHSLFLYSATQHVPLLIRLPGHKQKRIARVAGLIDIAPTILDWLGIEPDPSMQGRSLIPVIQEKENVPRFAYSESLFAELHYGWSPLKSLTTNEYKFIDAPGPELYDRKMDPGETKNIVNENVEIAGQMRKQLAETELRFTKQSKGPDRMDPETEEKLRALGYVGTVVRSDAESRKIDPKDKIVLLETLSKARRAMDQKDHATALKLAEEILAQDPQMVDAHFIASTSHLHLGHKEDALKEMMKTISLHPGHTQTLYNLAFLHQILGDLKTAEHWYLELLKYEPEHLVANLNLAGLYRRMDQRQKAREGLARVIQLYGDAARVTHAPESRSKLLETMAELYYRTGDIQQSETLLKQAVRLTPSRAILHFHLGVIYEIQKNSGAAKQKFQDAMRLLEGRELDPEEEQLRQMLNAKMQSR